MNWEAIARDWPQYGSAIRRQWPELRDEQLRIVAGRRAWLADCLQESYCLSRDLAEAEIDGWIAAFGDAEEEAGHEARHEWGLISPTVTTPSRGRPTSN